MKPVSPDAFNSHVNTWSPKMDVKKASPPINAVRIKAFIGIPLRLTLARNWGACLSFAIDHNIRVDAYSPEFPADSKEVNTTAFMTDAANASPARSKTSVKGLTEMFSTSPFSKLGLVYGIKRPSIRMAPM